MKTSKGSQGFIGTIVLIVLALAGLKFFFNFNVLDFFRSPGFVSVISYIKEFFEIIWFKYIGGAFWYIWNNIVIDLIWNTLVQAFSILKTWVDSN